MVQSELQTWSRVDICDVGRINFIVLIKLNECGRNGVKTIEVLDHGQ